MKTILLVVCLGVFALPLVASDPCPANDGPHWDRNTLVYYSLGNLSDFQKQQVRQAFSEWNQENDAIGNGIKFQEEDAQHPAVYTWNNGTLAGKPNAGAGTLLPPSGILTSTNTTIQQNAVLSDGTPFYGTAKAGIDTIYKKMAMHEIGHTLGLRDVFNGQPGATMENQALGTNDVGGNIPDSFDHESSVPAGKCDDLRMGDEFPKPPCDPTIETCGNPGGGGEDPGDPNGGISPIILDVENEGFHLTSATAGVRFDMRADGHPIQLAWPDPAFHNAFLALPEADGAVHSGKDLFGNFTAQDKSKHANGFLALAEWDEKDQGGNGDGIIDEHDVVFSRLRLWIDANHDGISQPEELHTLPELGVFSLDLDYRRSKRVDEFGNQYRYKARVNPRHHDERDDRKHGEENEVGRWAYDVFFVTQ